MNFFLTFLTYAMTALVFENTVLARPMGGSKMLHLVSSPKEIPEFAIIMGFVVTSTGLICVPIRSALPAFSSVAILPIIYIAVMIMVYSIGRLLLARLAPKAYERVKGSLATGTFNCAVLGALLIPATGKMGIVETLGYSLGATAGFALAVLLISLGMKRIELCNVPKAFKGLPILLIYVGLLSLALYGLIGHALPT